MEKDSEIKRLKEAIQDLKASVEYWKEKYMDLLDREEEKKNG